MIWSYLVVWFVQLIHDIISFVWDLKNILKKITLSGEGDSKKKDQEMNKEEKSQLKKGKAESKKVRFL